jgi:hypothetical protein
MAGPLLRVRHAQGRPRGGANATLGKVREGRSPGRELTRSGAAVPSIAAPRTGRFSVSPIFPSVHLRGPRIFSKIFRPVAAAALDEYLPRCKIKASSVRDR